MGENLQKAVEASNNQTWKVQLSSAISGDVACAVGVKYHLPCWVKNVQRGATSCREEKERAQKETNVAIVASDIEFVSVVHGLLQAGNVLNMTDLKSAYSSILESNVQPTTQGIKEKITSHIDDIHFMKSKRRNESDRVFSAAIRDAAREDAMA